MVYAEQETDELIAMLRETESLDEQGDILQYLVDTHGLEFNTGKGVSIVFLIHISVFIFYFY